MALIYLVVCALVFYGLLKVSRLIFSLYQHNQNLKHVPTNPGFPLTWGGYFQKLSHLPRAQMIETLGEASNSIKDEVFEKANLPVGVTKIYSMPFYPSLVVSDGRPMETIFRSSKHSFKGVVGNVFRTFNSGVDTLFTLEGQSWKDRRKLLARTMHKELHHDYSLAIKEQVVAWIENIRHEKTKKKSLRMFDYQYDLAARILAKNVFGQSLDDPEERRLFIETYEAVAEMYEKRLSNPLLFNPRIWNIYCWATNYNWRRVMNNLLANTKKLIRRRIEILEGQEMERTDEAGVRPTKLFIDVIYKFYQEKVLTFDDMIYECLLFFIAALDTTTHTMTGGIYGLSHPDSRAIQEKLAKEIDTFFPEKSDLLRNFNHDILNEMTYLDAVVKESLRYYGPAYFVNKCSPNDIIFDQARGQKVKSLGSGMPLNIFMMTAAASNKLMRETFNNPNEEKLFKPERFIKDKSDPKAPFFDSNNYAFAPFARGNRDCIGQPMAYLSMKMQLIFMYKFFRTEVEVRDEEDRKFDRQCQQKFVRSFKNQPFIKFFDRD